MSALRPIPRAARIVLAAGLLAASSGCSSIASGADGTLSVVASTNVYGDLATRIGGDAVTVTSFVSGTGQDPHSYDASAHDELALVKADVVIENGGGYDDFIDDLRHAAGARAPVLNAVEISGRTAPPGKDLNEHVWYDLPSMQRLVARLVAVLSAADPADAGDFAARAHRLSAGLRALERIEGQLREHFAGDGAAITEPVPLYLLQACGLIDRTPELFSAAVEAGTGVPVSVLNDTLQLFADRAVRVLVYNAQTSGPETDQVIAAAKSAGIATVPVTETLPSGQSYLSWMRANLAALSRALA